MFLSIDKKKLFQITDAKYFSSSTGKYFFASTNPQYDNRLFIELQVQYMKIPSSEHGENMFCTQHVLPMFMY